MAQVMKFKDFASREDETISAAVRALASGNGIDIPALATALRMPKTSIYAKLTGRSPWKASEVAGVARFFQVRVGDLYDGLGGRFGPDAPNGGAGAWAPRGSNPEPAD